MFKRLSHYPGHYVFFTAHAVVEDAISGADQILKATKQITVSDEAGWRSCDVTTMRYRSLDVFQIEAKRNKSKIDSEILKRFQVFKLNSLFMTCLNNYYKCFTCLLYDCVFDLKIITYATIL